MTKSLYAILNVAPDADPAVVEAAYKALMKKYHPDVRTEDPETARRRAAEINEAFHILKDPAKRSDYDNAERVRRETIRRNSAMMAEAPRPYQPPLPPRRRRSKWLGLFMIAAAAIAVFYIWRGSDAARSERAFRPISLSQVKDRLSELAPAKEGAKLAPVSRNDVHRAVAEFSRIKERTGLLGLSAYSSDCFAGQSRSGRASDFDFCVAFDKAALTYGLDLPGADYLPQLPRFEAKEIARRHAAAGKLLSNDEDLIQARIAEVGILTSQRLRLLNPIPQAAEEPVAVAAAAKYRRPVRTARRQPVRRPHGRNPRPRTDPDFLEREGYIY
jgi:curved DNA-binding protein CbpA